MTICNIYRKEMLAMALFRLHAGCGAKHAAIRTGERTMIRAQEGAPICEAYLDAWWRRHIAAAFCFPEPEGG